MNIQLINHQGNRYSYPMTAKALAAPQSTPSFNRIVYSAAHVVSNPLAAADPWLTTPLDWEATISYRRYLWSLGFGVAEAMDTAQRGMGLDWPTSLELIRRSLDAAVSHSRAELGAAATLAAGALHDAYADLRRHLQTLKQL